MSHLATFLGTYSFFVPLIVLMLSELTKASLDYKRTGNWHTGFFRPGGMPSTHSAFVTSVLMVVIHRSGITSMEATLAFALAGVVCYDAMTLRHSVGEQAEILNHLQQFTHLRERVGHSFLQVVVGIIFGIILTELAMLWIG